MPGNKKTPTKVSFVVKVGGNGIRARNPRVISLTTNSVSEDFFGWSERQFCTISWAPSGKTLLIEAKGYSPKTITLRSANRCDEALPLRMAQWPTKGLWVYACCRYQISKADFRSITRSYWYPYRSSTCGVWKVSWWPNGGDQRVDSQACAGGTQYSTDTFCEYRIIEYRCERWYARRGDTAKINLHVERAQPKEPN